MTSSPVQPVTTGRGAGGPGALVRYGGVATAARLGDAGSSIGILLLAVDRYGDGRGAVVGGLLTACITAPHVLGPWTGRLVDRARDPRRVLAAACAAFAVALCGGSLLIHAHHPWWAATAFAAAGCAGPLLTGGFSSLVAGLGGDVGRARGVDAITYGVAGTAGPAVLAAVASVASPLIGLLAVAAVVAAAGGGCLWLPTCSRRSHWLGPNSRATAGPQPPRTWLLMRSRPLRQVTITTVAVAAGGGVLAVSAVLLAAQLHGAASGHAAWLITALGAGNLAGAAFVVVRPLRGEPVRQSLVLAVGLAAATAAAGLAWDLVSALAVYATVGLLTGPWVTATLNARQRYAPHGRTASVFVAMAGIKVAGTSTGTAPAGVLSHVGARPLLLASGALIATSVLTVSSFSRRPRVRTAPS